MKIDYVSPQYTSAKCGIRKKDSSKLGLTLATLWTIYSLPGSSVHGILQARVLEWVCNFLLQGIFQTQESNQVPSIAGRFFTNWATWEVRYAAAAAKSLQLCPTLWDLIDSSPPGSPIPGILQGRTLEWVAISFSNAWKWSRSVVSNS